MINEQKTLLSFSSTFIMTADMLPKSVIDIDSYVNLGEEDKTPSKASFKYKTDSDDSHTEYKEVRRQSICIYYGVQ